jgi:hypothetical protein
VGFFKKSDCIKPFASGCNRAVSNPCMAKALRAGIVAAILIAVLAIATGVNGQTKDSPLLLYKGGGPVPKKIKTVIPKYPASAQAGSMVLELTLRPDGKVDAVTAIRPLRGATEAAIFEYCPYKGVPPNGITRANEAPKEACAQGTARRGDQSSPLRRATRRARAATPKPTRSIDAGSGTGA